MSFSAGGRMADNVTKAIGSGHAAAPEGKLERLQKILAAAGVASRRKAEEIILAGRVQVNGQVVAELGTKLSLIHISI